MQGPSVHFPVRLAGDAHEVDQEHLAARRLLRLDARVPQDDDDGAVTALHSALATATRPPIASRAGSCDATLLPSRHAPRLRRQG
mmetsp:Transcript_28291/g.48413  ORF Transcript_28291/g.48413 Transcript_28291/m.48413 type:complete len:85 (+) Transcript_28291:666-920(+)